MGDASFLAVLELLFLAIPLCAGLLTLDWWERRRTRRVSGTRQPD